MYIPWSLKLKMASWKMTSFFLPKLTAQWAENLFLRPVKHHLPDSEKKYYETAKKNQILSGLQVYEWGSDAHPKVLLIHGWSGRGTQMGAFAEPLVQNNFHVIALDGPAHGLSKGQYTHVGDFTASLVAVQKHFGPLKATIAHSFGAGCSVLAVHRGLSTEKLVLIAGPSRYERVIQNYLDRLKLSNSAQKYFFKSMEQKVQLPAQQMNVGHLAQTITQPILVVHDQHDKEVPVERMYEIKNDCPRAELLETQHLGHRRILKDAATVQRIIQFILK